MRIACKSSGLCIKSNNPQFKYHFKKAGTPVEVKESDVAKILLNTDFYESDKPVPIKKEIIKKEVEKETWEEELSMLFDEKEVIETLKHYSTKGKLLEALEKDDELVVGDSLQEKLKAEFIS